MTDRTQVAALVVSAALLLAVLELVRRRKLAEEYSFLWILSALALLILSMKRDMLDAVARWLGVEDARLMLIAILIGILSTASLCFSVILSRQRQQIERLIEETAILSAELRDLRSTQTGPRENGADGANGSNTEQRSNGGSSLYKS